MLDRLVALTSSPSMPAPVFEGERALAAGHHGGEAAHTASGCTIRQFDMCARVNVVLVTSA